MIARLSSLVLACAVLGACQHTRGSIAGGECKVFERPEYAVVGKTNYDQNWIDSQVEGGVGGCGWQRPAARPPALDAVPAAKKKAVAPVKKKSFVKRIKERVVAPFIEPVAPVVESPPVVVVEPAPVPAPVPPPKPRDPVDELLQPETQ